MSNPKNDVLKSFSVEVDTSNSVFENISRRFLYMCKCVIPFSPAENSVSYFLSNLY